MISCYTNTEIDDWNFMEGGNPMAEKTARRNAAQRAAQEPARPAGPEYGPNTTGCPAVVQAIERLYAGQTEECFWALMNALNYALEMGTEVLVPLDAVQSAQNGAAPWAANPVPAERAANLRFWTLRNEGNDKIWLPVFTSGAAAVQDRGTASRPMVQRKLCDVMEFVLTSEQITGMVIDPWSQSASLERSLLNGLLHARPDAPEENDPAQQTEREIWEWLREGDRIAARRDGGPTDPGRALMAYRRAYAAACWQPDIAYWPEICLRLARYEVRYTSREEALRLAAEARHGLRLRAAEGDAAAHKELEQAEALCRELAAPPAQWAAYSTERSQKD